MKDFPNAPYGVEWLNDPLATSRADRIKTLNGKPIHNSLSRRKYFTEEEVWLLHDMLKVMRNSAYGGASVLSILGQNFLKEMTKLRYWIIVCRVGLYTPVGKPVLKYYYKDIKGKPRFRNKGKCIRMFNSRQEACDERNRILKEGNFDEDCVKISLI